MYTHNHHRIQALRTGKNGTPFQLKLKPQRLFTVAVATVLLATGIPAYAFDFGSMVTGALRNGTISNQDMISAFRSVAQVSFGKVPNGAAAPQDAAGKVVLYRTAGCPFCKQAADYMQQKSIPFVERDVETEPASKAEYARLGGKGVPFLVFGQKTMLGTSPAAIDQNYAEFQRSLANGTAATAAGASSAPQPGDTLIGKIPGVQVYRQPSKTADKFVQLAKADAVIYMGEERDGLYRVTTAQGEGWVDKLLVKKP